MSAQRSTLKQKAYHEMKEFLVIAVYLWVFLSLFVLHKSVILGTRYFDVVEHGFALINALALGKVMLIAREIRNSRRKGAKEGPLLFPALFSAALFALLLAFFKIVEEAAVAFYHGKSFAEVAARLAQMDWIDVLIFTVILYVVLIPLCAFYELQEFHGEGVLEHLFLHGRLLEDSDRIPVRKGSKPSDDNEKKGAHA